ncbi:MAG: lipid II:glycine glycyltransferase (peptidoglycan interpeptide bridge formation enzyme) [Polaribacter sp.]|jgi:lipid II:glycine glycyltransferase (peptidoglycan interpeptide bridge formation enzyme)
MIHVIKLDTKQGINTYETLLSSLDVSDPYFSKEYLDIFSNGTKNLICFFLKSTKNDVTAFMPGYLNTILINGKETNYYDFTTPYGYTGPFFSKEITEIEIKEFWKLIDEWYLNNRVISEFVRFNLFGNQEYYSGKVFSTLLNVKGNIIDEEDQWTAFNHKVRKNVNKAKRENLSSEVYFLDISDEKISEFYDIYLQTMKRTNAKETFLYSFKEFKRFIHNNENHSAICTIYFEEIPVSSELLLISEDSIYSFLGGTNDKYFDKRPNDFLKFKALNWARTQGKKHYILGGGYGLEDGIFKYKKGFFPNNVVNYYTGRKILNKKVYYQLVSEASNFRIAKGLDKLDIDDDSFFPLYCKVD